MLKSLGKLLLLALVWRSSRHRRSNPVVVAPHAVPPVTPMAPTIAPPKSRRVLIAMAVLVFVFSLVGYRLFRESSPGPQTPPSTTGGIVVLATEPNVTLSASMELSEPNAAAEDLTPFRLSLRFFRKAQSYISLSTVLAPVLKTKQLPFVRPLRFVVLFSGSATPAVGPVEESLWNEPVPQVSDEGCEAYMMATNSQQPACEATWSGHPRPEIRADGEHRLLVEEAYGYTSHGYAVSMVAEAVPGVTTSHLESRATKPLVIEGFLAKAPSVGADGRVQGSLTTIPASFPADAEFPHPKTGAYLTSVTLPGEQPPLPAGLTLTGVSGTLYPAHVVNSSFSVTKGAFEQVDFTNPVSEAADTNIHWKGPGVNTPFRWQLSNDDAITTASSKFSRYGLLAGLAFGIAGSILAVLLQRLFETWDIARTLRRIRRPIAWLLAALLSLVAVFAGGSAQVTTIAFGPAVVTYRCPAAFAHFNEAPIPQPDVKPTPGQELQSQCAEERLHNRRIALLTGIPALVLWIYLLVSRRRRRKRLRAEQGQSRALRWLRGDRWRVRRAG